MTFEQIKKNYDRKLWNKQMVAKAVASRKALSLPHSIRKSQAKS